MLLVLLISIMVGLAHGQAVLTRTVTLGTCAAAACTAAECAAGSAVTNGPFATVALAQGTPNAVNRNTFYCVRYRYVTSVQNAADATGINTDSSVISGPGPVSPTVTKTSSAAIPANGANTNQFDNGGVFTLDYMFSIGADCDGSKTLVTAPDENTDGISTDSFDPTIADTDKFGFIWDADICSTE